MFGSVAVSAQLPEHTVEPLGQTHALLVHVVPEGHTLPHAPQLFGSVFVFAHALLEHLVSPVPQDVWQTPFEQRKPLQQSVEVEHVPPELWQVPVGMQ